MDDGVMDAAVSTLTAAALLVLSRDRLAQPDYERAKALCNRVTDWSLLTDTAHRKFSLPFVYRNLSWLYPNGSMTRVLDEMRPGVMHMQMASLRMISAQRAFHESCIRPMSIRHAYLKGPALAATFHDDPGLRFCRDIDVLVPEKELTQILEAALDADYEVICNSEVPQVLTRPEDWRALLRYSPVIMLISPSGVPIELHKEVDKNIGIFAIDRLFADGATVRLGGTDMHTLTPEVMFCFACYHNTRHLWSRLHWLADLSAMIGNPNLDLDKARSFSDEIGLRPTVEACIELDGLARKGGSTRQEGHGAELLEMCIKNLGGDLQLERKLRADMHSEVAPFPWLLSRKARRRAEIRRLLRRFAPTFEQYQHWPLPDSLQWLYYPSKPVYSIMKRMWRDLG